MKQTEYGVDVAIMREDDLDRKIVDYVKIKVAEGQVPTVLDLGCAAGGQSVRMALAGANVFGVDIEDYSDVFAVLRTDNKFSQQQFQFKQGNATSFLCIIDNTQIDICVLQRVIHYFTYEDALSLLCALKKSGIQKMYISVTGIDSDIGRDYADRDKRVEDRFCRLNDADSKTFSISEPVCLYTPEEFILLLQESGLEIEECWVSAFGNIKAVCR